MTSHVKKQNTGATPSEHERGTSRRMLQQKQNSSRSLPIVAWQVEVGEDDTLDDYAPGKRKSKSVPPERRISRRNSWVQLSSSEAMTVEDGTRTKSTHERGATKRNSWEIFSNSLHTMVDDLMKSLKDEELPVDSRGRGRERRNSVGSNVAARVSEIVEDKDEFRKLKEEMRETGMTTGAGAMQQIVRLDDEE